MTIFGILALTLGILRAMPQLLQLLRARHAYGVSVDTAATSMIVSFGWVVYGFLTHQPYISVASGASSLICALITVFALRFGRHLRELRVAPVWLLVILIMGSLGGATGLSIVLPISVLAANIPQVWVAYKEGDLTDLSLGMWLLSMTEGLLWGGYGLMMHDIAVIVNNSFQVSTSAMIVGLKLAHMARQAKQSETVVEDYENCSFSIQRQR
jgi:uncharacterized protein with PQ loop repeat